jgi:hypothetical protein
MTSSLWGTGAKYPAAVVASNEPGTATFHSTDLGASADELAFVCVAICSGKRGNCGDDCEKTEEESFHF